GARSSACSGDRSGTSRGSPPWQLATLFLEGFLALDPDGGRGEHKQQSGSNDQEGQADRLLKENHGIATRDQQRAAQILLHHRSQHETENERRRLTVELERDVTEHREERHHERIERLAVDDVDADAAKTENRGVKH